MLRGRQPAPEWAIVPILGHWNDRERQRLGSPDERWHTQVMAAVVGGSATEPSQDLDAPTERRLSGHLDRLIEGRETLAEVLFLALSAGLAWLVRFTQDDAFITFRFSRNLARGEGLVFNPGEQVEGYTNFLYAVVHALPERLGWNTPLFSQVYGIALFLVTLALAMRTARALFSSRGFGFLVGLTLTANMTFLAYATAGMETMQQTLCLTAVVLVVLPALIRGDALDVRPAVVAGVFAALAVLTRIDSIVYLAPLLVAVAHRQWKLGGRDLRRPARTLVIAAVPFLLLTVPWVIWKVGYYGEWLPNTFFAKTGVGRLVPTLWAAAFVVAFVLSYGAFLLIGRFRARRAEFFSTPGVAPLFAIVPVWVLYIFYTGSDFMEFRFAVVLLPVIALLAAYLIDRFVNPLTEGLLVAVLLLFSLGHQVPVANNVPVMTFESLSLSPDASAESWVGLGRSMGELFPGGPDEPGQPVIAAAPIGAIGYFGDLETVDMFGLTDAWVARNADPLPVYYPGHLRMAPADYLVDRGVDLVLGFPGVVTRESVADIDSYRLSQLLLVYPGADLNELPDDAVVVEIPAGPDHVWQTIYFGGNELVDQAIIDNEWSVKQIEHRCAEEDLADWTVRQSSKATCGT